MNYGAEYEDQSLVECIRAVVRQDSDALSALEFLLALIRAALMKPSTRATVRQTSPGLQ